MQAKRNGKRSTEDQGRWGGEGVELVRVLGCGGGASVGARVWGWS